MRMCDECGRSMTQGYVIDGGYKYYCSDECLHKNYTEEEWLELYDNGNSDSYWTEWEEETEQDYMDAVKELIYDKILEAENSDNPDISEQYLEGYKAGLNHALIIIQEFERGC